MMFNHVLRCFVSRATIGIAASAPADRLRDRNNVALIGDNFTEIGNDDAGIVEYRLESDPMLNSILNGDWSNFVLGRQFPKGVGVPLWGWGRIK